MFIENHPLLSTFLNLDTFRTMRRAGLSLMFVAGFLAACIHLPRSFHALHYQNQRVYLDKNHYYQVGPLSKEWRKLSRQEPGIVFKHGPTGATLATAAVCGAAFEDLPLAMLTRHLFAGLDQVTKQSEERWVLSGRGALYTEAEARLDGVPVTLQIVVTQKNRCQFDFWLVAPAGTGEGVRQDFLAFVKGFDYR